jgi:hypothetical protein
MISLIHWILLAQKKQAAGIYPRPDPFKRKSPGFWIFPELKRCLLINKLKQRDTSQTDLRFRRKKRV